MEKKEKKTVLNAFLYKIPKLVAKASTTKRKCIMSALKRTDA